jgi:hypothetical protein
MRLIESSIKFKNTFSHRQIFILKTIFQVLFAFVQF